MRRSGPVVVWLHALILGVRPFSQWNGPKKATSRVWSASKEQILFYSPNFHRHVVSDTFKSNRSSAFESFQWLDEAQSKYPGARRVGTSGSLGLETILGLGLESTKDYFESCDLRKTSFTIGASLPSDLEERLQNVVAIIDSNLGAPLLSYFSSNVHSLVLERILFLLAPFSNVDNFDDPPRLFHDGHGAGFSDEQAVSAILSLRHLLSFCQADALQKKPPSLYFYQQLKVSFERLNEARAELEDWLFGASQEDVATFAYLNSIGVCWQQCRFLLQAFSVSLISCDLTMRQASVNYLRTRLYLSPSEVFAMINTHSRLSQYSSALLKKHVDEIQVGLSLSSRDMRRLIVRSPSVLGCSTSKINARISFLANRVHLSPMEMQQAVLVMPSLLKYNIESNLEPKIRFLEDKAGISNANLAKLVIANPLILGSSLEQRIEPVIVGFQETCGLSKEELCDVLLRVPKLVTASWKTQLEPKLDHLRGRLQLSDATLKQIVVSTPSLLMRTNLDQKIDILLDAVSSAKMMSAMIQEDPAVLLQSAPTLKCTLGPHRKTKSRSRRKRPVDEYLGGDRTRTFVNVGTAAIAVGTSRGNMYSIVKTGRIYNEKTYAYGALGEDSNDEISAPGQVNERTEDEVQKRMNVSLATILRESSISASYFNQTRVATGTSTLYLTAFVSGKACLNERKAHRKSKAGGISIYFPQLRDACSRTHLEQAARSCFASQVIPKAEKCGTSYSNGLLMLGYAYKRPTGNRCGLYACWDALRLILELLSSDVLEPGSPSIKDCKIHVDIFTDSSYVSELIHNTSSLLRWGSYKQRDDFVHDGDMPAWQANIDILHPFSRTYCQIVNQKLRMPSTGLMSKLTTQEIRIRFRHDSEVSWAWRDPKIKMSGRHAMQAAKWQSRQVYRYDAISEQLLEQVAASILFSRN